MENIQVIRPQTDRQTHTIEDLQGLNRIVFEAIDGVTHVAESLHSAVLHSAILPIGAILTMGGLLSNQNLKVPGIPGLVYQSIRSTSRCVDIGLKQVLNQIGRPFDRCNSLSRYEREILVSALNGVCGDYLLEKNNPLSISMQIYHGELQSGGANVRENIIRSKGRVLLMIPGVCMSDLQWARNAQNLGASLAEGLKAVPLYVNYNSGKHISHNGAELAEQLNLLCDEYPEISEISILGYSMGGLVARSAHYYAERISAQWAKKLAAMVFLGTPHHGSAWERGGNFVDALLGTNLYSRPFQKISRLRSSGITDLRYGNITDEDWSSHDRFKCVGDQRVSVPLPNNIQCFSLAGVTAKKSVKQKRGGGGDGLVPVSSALGRHTDPKHQLSFLDSHQSVITDCHHLQLLSDKRVEAALLDWLV